MGSSADCPNEQLCKAELHSLYMTVHLYTLDNLFPASCALITGFAQLGNLLQHATW